MKKTGTIYNILGVYHLADEIDRAEGARAYQSYWETMKNFADVYGMGLRDVAGIFAVLSPVNDYKGNLRSLKSVLEARNPEFYMLDHPDRIVVTTTTPNKLKAIRIAKGEDPEKVIGPKSLKVMNFWHSIVQPNNPTSITIDRHMMSVWQGKRDKDGRVENYDRVADDFRKAAKLLSISPCSLQATCWFVWKRLNAIVYDPHRDLFEMPRNFWQAEVMPNMVQAFPQRKPGEKSKYVSGAEKRRRQKFKQDVTRYNTEYSHMTFALEG